jgi:CheY-like chemotaxis protein
MRPHLLLIDDDEDELRILSDALRDAGIDCKCTWATSPIQALDILKYLPADFIFIDYNMPKMNGIECISHIRKLPDRCDIPLILYSNALNDTLVQQALDAGAYTCLKKTSDNISLRKNLQTVFSAFCSYAH